MLNRHLEPDLIAIDVLTLLLVVVVLAIPAPLLREVLGVCFVLFFPGYVLAAAIFPRPKSLRAVVRVALSLALSLAAGVFLGLILCVTPRGFSLNSILGTMSGFTLAVSCLAWYLRGRYYRISRPGTKPTSFFAAAFHSLKSAGWGYRSLVIFLLVVIVGGLVSLGGVMFRPLPSRTFTEFYILGAGGKAADYPRELHTGEEGRVIIGVVNHEATETFYNVDVAIDGAPEQELAGITLKPDEKWQRDFSFTLRETGADHKVEFLLYEGAGAPEATRYIWVNVIE
jgi:uncharacterized membrane protein